MYSLMKALPLLLIAAAATASDEAAAAGLRHTGAESVSAEPLTFTAEEPEVPDRARLLAEAEDLPMDADIMEEVDEGDADAPEEAAGLTPLDFQVDGIDEDLTDEELGLLIGADAEEEFYSADWDEEEGDVDVYSASYDSSYDADADFYDEAEEAIDLYQGEDEEGDEEEEGEGFDEVGEPFEAEPAPITRKLRRRLDVTVEAESKAEVYPGGMDEARYLAMKEALRKEAASVPLFDTTQLEEGESVSWMQLDSETEYDEEVHGRHLAGCRATQKRIIVQVKTDNYGHENSFTVKRNNGSVVMRGPAQNRNWADNQSYVAAACLNAGTYVFKMVDKARDGMCGNRSGKGLYRVYVGGAKKHTSPANCSVNWGTRTYRFTVRTQTQNNNNNQSRPQSSPNVSRPQQAAISGRGGCKNVKVQFKVDKYGRETTMTLTGNGRTHMESRNEVGAYQTKTITKCLPPGTYTLRMQDRDGINQGSKGFYKMWVDNQMAVSGSYFVGSKAHTIKIGSNWQSSMGTRARDWLNSHNARRRKYNGGKGYVAMRWSNVLARDALSYANQLGNNCNGALKHKPGLQDGENLARNFGSGSWGAQRATDAVMKRWVENELSWKWPKNAHYTQVVWRATQYVGCGESMKKYGNKICRTQVCRYARAGNCNVRNGNWRSEAWKDETKCGRECPGACFI